MNFASDNAYGAWPEIVAAIAAAASGAVPSYGDDALTQKIRNRLCDLFACDLAVFPVISGTAANALALATLVPPHGAVVCHREAHIAVDECGAPEFFTHGAKLIALEGEGAKLAPDGVERALAHFQKGFVHHVQPMALSITQSTELGTVYTADETKALSALAHAHGMKVHMDGARFANALCRMGCTPAEATWQAGIDVLSFGATKNGALGAEAVIFFHPEDAGDFEYRRKKAGHLISKMRFVSAQLDAYLTGDRWLVRAGRANALARRLADGLGRIAGVEIAYPVEANAVFAWLPDAIAAGLRAKGAVFYDWGPPQGGRTLVRLVASFATPEEDVDRLLAAANG
ncbi:MAG: low specificity L-threonine aldolase [Alphaproteobacteria bacterium]|nr:low specificity L-threonine aldolase [Alphaproteobacteria bacterium]MDE2112385.1 low specificity L-threonine aldolase [Alphaproteobacteria bacterium]MDE2495310.1 low specificity L-threonine aldolase [Alphaproteobacteria bacterium]